MKELCLVSASGGFDSSLTLSMLALAGYENIVACHFKYGHRGQLAEEMALSNVCKELDKRFPNQIIMKVFDIENLMRSIDETSMLIDPNAEITTGTDKGLKKLDAWVCGRNMMFMTIMGTYAESLVMENDFDKVYFLGGFLNLTESGHYPDNSEYFVSSMLEMFKYGTLIGNKISPMFGLSNLMKSDQFALIDAFDLKDIYKHTISCDRPIIKYPIGDNSHPEPIPCNCSKDGIPACGSGLLSWWASKMVGLDDMEIRNFYEVIDPNYVAHIPGHIEEGAILEKDITAIINRILFPEDKLKMLQEIYNAKQPSNSN